MRNAGLLSTARLLNAVLRAVYAVALARLLGPDLYGLFTVAQGWYLLAVPLALVGADVMLPRRLAVRDGAAPQTLADSLRLVLVAAPAVALAAFVLMWTVGGIGPDLVLVSCAALVARSIATWCQSVFVGWEDSRLTFRQEVTVRPLEVLTGIAAVSAGGGVVAVAVVHTAWWTFQAAWGLLLVRRRTPGLLATRGGHVADLVREGLPVAVGAALWLGVVHGPMIAGSRLVGQTDAGSLALVLQVWYVGNAVVGAVALSSLPGLARSHAAADGRAQSLVTSAVAACLIGSVGVAIGVGALLGPVLRWVLGPAYDVAVDAVPVAVVLVGLTAAGAMLQNLLIVRGSARVLVPASVVALAGLGLTFLLHPGGGITVPLEGTSVGLAAWDLALAAGTVGHRDLRRVRLLTAVLAPLAALAGIWLT